MDAIETLRRFFEQQLASSKEAFKHLGLNEDVSSQHLVSYLVEQTVCRAAVDAATHHRSLAGAPGPSPTGVSWKHCLMVAALTELRSFMLSTRSRI